MADWFLADLNGLIHTLGTFNFAFKDGRWVRCSFIFGLGALFFVGLRRPDLVSG